ncbi:MAG: TRAP transporter small permease [Treponemataceae bacterium]
MSRILSGIVKIDKILYIIAGTTLVCMVLLTLVDVILRNFGHPITGSMEFIQYGGSIVFAFSVPYATFLKAQVQVDLVLEKLKPSLRKIVNIITRIIGIIFFLFVSYNFVQFGFDSQKAGEVTASFRLPLYPIIFAIAVSFFFQSLTILHDLIETIRTAENE